MRDEKDTAKRTTNVSRRSFLTRLAAAGAGVAATAFFPRFDAGLRRAAEAMKGGTAPTAEGGYAFTADAGSPGRLLRWGATAEAAEQQKITFSRHYHVLGEPYRVSDKRQWVMVIDLAKCNGCADCQAACSSFHRIPQNQEWIKIYRLKDNPDGSPYWFPRVCMQCDNPPCAKVCPVDATYKREDGIILIDQDRCIGCRFCIAACPYSARYFNWSDPTSETPEQKAEPYSIETNTPHRRGVAEKCLFCPSMVKDGKLPVCAAACTMNALYFGDRNEDAVTNRAGETLRFSELMKQGAFRSQEELGTEPRVYYLPPRGRQYPVPPAPSKS